MWLSAFCVPVVIRVVSLIFWMFLHVSACFCMILHECFLVRLSLVLGRGQTYVLQIQSTTVVRCFLFFPFSPTSDGVLAGVLGHWNFRILPIFSFRVRV